MPTRSLRRIVAALAVLAVAASACADGNSADGNSADGDSADGDTGQPGPGDGGRDGSAVGAQDGLVDIADVETSPRESVPSALDDPRHESFPEPLVDVADIRSGGPPPDGIPPLDDPRFERVADVDWLDPVEPVLSLVLDGEARAYPLQVMTWHEIVNDTVAGRGVTVSFCPLCNSAVAYERLVAGRTLDFGTSGRLLNSSLVMYDRQTESLWSHFTGQAVVGVLTGTELDLVPVSTVAWSAFADAHPDGLVLSRETGFARDYGRNPYTGYDDPDGRPFLFSGETDDRLSPQARVIVVRGDGEPAVVRHDDLVERRVINLEAQGRPVVVVLVPGTASALDTDQVSDGRDVGATGAFLSVLDGVPVDLLPTDTGFVDRESGSTFDIFGTALDGPLAGRSLVPVEHLDTFWFAIAAFSPDAEIVS